MSVLVFRGQQRFPKLRHHYGLLDGWLIKAGKSFGHVRGVVTTLALVPAVVDVVGDTPVVAAGGIADGRGMAAALMLGRLAPGSGLVSSPRRKRPFIPSIDNGSLRRAKTTRSIAPTCSTSAGQMRHIGCY